MRNVLITGVSSGIGRALARFYLAAGDRVYGLSRRAPQDLIQTGLHFVSVDLAEPTTVSRSISGLLDDSQHLDLAILNAAMLGQITDVSAQTLAEIHEIMQVNVWSNKLILDSILAQGRNVKQVIAISSGAGIVAKRGLGAYGISKAALNMLVQLYANEFADTHFVSFSPGAVDSAMQERIRATNSDQRFPIIESLRSRHGTAAMPAAESIAARMADVFEWLPHQVASGAYTDLRDWQPIS